MTSFPLPHLLACLRIAVVALALAPVACSGALLAPIPDGGPDGGASPSISEAGSDASPDGTVPDGGMPDEASSSTDAADSSATSKDASPDVVSDAGADATSDASTDGGSDAAPGDAGPPEILSLSETVSSITEGDSFTVIAIVTDPLGLSNIVGGQLTSDSGAVLGAFVPTTQGTYSLTVSWAQLNTAAAINFTGQTSRTLRATFFDAQGFQASKDISVGLYCGSSAAPDAACAGYCVNLTSIGTCGSCAASCADAGGFVAQDASCAAPGVCAWLTAVSPQTPNDTCASACARGGGSCASAQMTPQYSVTPIAESCTASPSSIGGSIEAPADVLQIWCSCYPGNVAATFLKTQTGNCASQCASSPGSPACVSTLVYVAATDGTTTEIIDTCSAPYLVGVGTVWDDVIEAHVPENEPVLSPGSFIDCHCTGTAP